MKSLLKPFSSSMLIGVMVAAVMSAAAIGVIVVRHKLPSPRLTLTSQSGAKLNAYTGLGAWVDLWDKKAWRDPTAAVADMHAHGVHTLFLQTATPRTPAGIANPTAVREFITAAHAREILVVAWYLPRLKSPSADLEKIRSAIEFTTDEGQRFDSVAIDIESTAVKPLSKRNRNLAELSRLVRASAGPSYPLGGIIPSPVGLGKQAGFWDVFPYSDVAKTYDVLLPMGYYTYRGHTGLKAYADAVANMRILREQPGCETIPVHLIGGIAGPSSAEQVGSFSQGARESGCIGASIYDWSGMNRAKWRELGAPWAPRAR